MTFFPNLPKNIAKSVKDKADLGEWDQTARPMVKAFRLK